jgi:hypothetical protein
MHPSCFRVHDGVLNSVTSVLPGARGLLREAPHCTQLRTLAGFRMHGPYFPMHRPYFPMHRPCFPVHSPYFPVHSPYFPVHSPYFPVHGPYFPVHGPCFPVNEACFGVHRPHFPVHGPCFRVHGPCFAVHTVCIRVHAACFPVYELSFGMHSAARPQPNEDCYAARVRRGQPFSHRVLPKGDVTLIQPNGKRIQHAEPPADIAMLRRGEAAPSARGLSASVIQGVFVAAATVVGRKVLRLRLD